jgi:hypothetical protein
MTSARFPNVSVYPPSAETAEEQAQDRISRLSVIALDSLKSC